MVAARQEVAVESRKLPDALAGTDKLNGRAHQLHFGLRFEHGYGIAQEVRCQQVIGIVGEDVLSLRFLHRTIARSARAGILLTEEVYALVVVHKGLCDVYRLVRRTIIYQDHFKVGIGRSQHGLERFGKKRLHIIYRDDNGYEGGHNYESTNLPIY